MTAAALGWSQGLLNNPTIWTAVRSFSTRGADLGLALVFLSLPCQISIAALRRRRLPCNWLFGLGFCSALLLGLSFGVSVIAAPTPPLMLTLAKLSAVAIALPLAWQFSQRLPGLLALPSVNQLALINQVLQRKVSEHRRTETELTQLNAELEARVEQRTAALSQTLEQLQQSETQLIAKNQHLAQTLSELQVAQSQLIQNEKMVSLGHLVAGIAHEINNPIGFIYTNLHHLQHYTRHLLQVLQRYQQELPVPSPALAAYCDDLDLDFVTADLPSLLSSMENGTARICDIVNSLRSFARLDEAALKRVDLAASIESALLLLQYRLHATLQRPEIRVETDYAALPPVECYPAQLNQVFANLLTNAMDAIDSQATWSPDASPCIRITLQPVDDWVEIAIADNGSGFSNTVRHHLFDPFFTTKPVGQGRGLGLTVSHQIVTENHGGELQARSRPAGGAEFSLRLPRVLSSRVPACPLPVASGSSAA